MKTTPLILIAILALFLAVFASYSMAQLIAQKAGEAAGNVIAEKLSRQQFGAVGLLNQAGRVTTKTALTISGATSTSVLSPNSNRVWATLQNDDASNVVYCSPVASGMTTSTAPWRINAAGGTLQIDAQFFWNGAISCMSNGNASSSLRVAEGVEQ